MKRITSITNSGPGNIEIISFKNVKGDLVNNLHIKIDANTTYFPNYFMKDPVVVTLNDVAEVRVGDSD